MRLGVILQGAKIREKRFTEREFEMELFQHAGYYFRDTAGKRKSSTTILLTEIAQRETLVVFLSGMIR